VDERISRLGAPAYFCAHSAALRSNSFGSFIIILATSASCGSFGSGDSMSWPRERIAVFIVRTGDHPSFRVSRQIAPCGTLAIDIRLLFGQLTV
jgi:hypothetical protein